MTNKKNSTQFRRVIAVALLATVFGLVIMLIANYQSMEIKSDSEALDLINWGENQADLRAKFTGTGTTIASLGYRNVGRVDGCDGADAKAIGRRAHIFAVPDTGIKQCKVTIASVLQAEATNDIACLDAVRSKVAAWKADWDPKNLAESAYEFQNVFSTEDEHPNASTNLYDEVWTIEQLAGWPIGDPVVGFENSPTVWNGDYLGWSPSANEATCPVSWLQCFDEKEPLYRGVVGLEALGNREGMCIVEPSPEKGSKTGSYALFTIMREIAPDVSFVITSFAKNREDSMSRAADWLIENQARFNIVAARTSNIVLLETELLNPGLQELCGDEAWCSRAGQVPYENECTGNPYEGGKAYAYKSIARLPKNYLPMAHQYERMHDAGIVAVKGAGHEGWKAALPYPDCSPALVTVGAVYAGSIPREKKRTALTEDGWINQGWRWDPSSYCEENTVERDQISCITNNADKMGYKLPNNEVASPLMSPHPMESLGGNLGNAWVTPYVVAAVAVLKSNNLAPDINAAEVMDIIHRNGDVVWDRRQCDQDPGKDDPDGWVRAGFDFFDLILSPPPETKGSSLSKREIQLLDHPWAYSCTDPDSPDTAPFHMDNAPDHSNRRLNIGAAVSDAMN